MKIAIMGFGVVGSGVGEVISTNQNSFLEKIGEKIEVGHILDLRDFPDSEYKCFTKNFEDILNDDEITAVVEVMGGEHPAYEFTKKLLMSGKHVVSSNKELVAKHGTELLKIAKERNINYMFEASVGGGIPIIRPLYSCLTAGEISRIYGILNGTTNYILTRMFKDGASFESALKEAQEKGYAEKDPTADVDGIDACRKISILGSLAFGKYVDCREIPTEGIRKITLEDVEYASELNCSIKLIGACTKDGDGVFARVCPMFVSSDNPLACITDVFNGIVVDSDELGDVMFYGRGAGKLPTASAVVADIIDIAKHKNKNVMIKWEDAPENYLHCKEEQKYCYYLRISGADKNAFSDLCTAQTKKLPGEFAVVTPELNEKEYSEFLAKRGLKKENILSRIRFI